ncbi:MAG: TonB family protein [Cellvibrionaceae bacterium]
MTPLALCIQLVVKPLIIIGLGALQSHASKSFSASIRHLNLLMVMLLLPAAAAIGFMIEAPITIALPDWGTTRQWLATTPGLVMIGAYLFGVLWGLFYLCLGVFELQLKTVDRQLPSYSQLQSEIDRLCHLTGIQKSVTLILSEVDPTIASWGWRRPKIQLPVEADEWPVAERQLILLHELGHIERRDWILLMVSKCVSQLFWFLPPVWWLQKMLSEMSERACDDWVIQVSGRDGDYAQLLLSLEKQLSDLPVSHLWAHSNYRRIQALLERYADHEIHLEPMQWGQSSMLALLVLLPLTAVGFRGDISSEQSSQSHYVISGYLSELARQQGSSDGKDVSPFKGLLQPNAGIEKPIYVDQLTPLDNPVAPKAFMEQLDVVAHALEAEVMTEVETLSFSQIKATRPNVQVKGFLPIKMATPIYPRRAIDRGIEGRVKVQFTVGTDGVPRAPTIVFSQPKGIFDKSVFKALKQSRFRPITINGAITEVKGVSEEFIFKLRESIDQSPPATGAPPPMTKVASAQ